MKKEEKVPYLANVYYVLISDVAVDRVGEKVFEEISRDVGAGYFERKKAMEMAKNEEFQVQLAGRWSERIGNLEDMLFAAYCNGVLEPTEKKLIADYANQLGINQRQMDIVQKETKGRYALYKGNAT